MATCPIQDFLNPTTPLWLSALNPTASPANLTVSSLLVAATGGISLLNNNTAYPAIEGAYLDFNREPGALPAELTIVPSKDVPTKAFETSYLAAVTNNGTVYDDMAMRGLQVYGNQITSPAANTGCAGYITQGSLPFSLKIYTGQLEVENIEATVGNFSTINVSSINGGGGGGGGGITDPLNISSINTSSINAGNAFISTATVSTLLANTINVSTLNVSSFALGNSLNLSSLSASTLNAGLANISSLNVSTISSGTITAGVGTFSTLNFPGTGSITNSTINTSTITTGVLSTTIGVIKEVFTSSMTFNATLSPNFDLGLGGIIGGMAGGFGANALGVGLGAAGLGTGIAGLVMPRTNGGINPNIFQTVNGTSQLQFSTIGVSTSGVLFNTFIDTASADPYRVPGLPLATVTAIPPGSYCMRTVSDPINLANSSGLAGEGIQSFSSWTPVYPGALQVKANSISSILTGNTISLGETLGDNIQVNPAPGRSINLNGQTVTSSIIVQGNINASSTLTPYVGARQVFTSTLNVSTFNIGNVAYQNFVASSITVSTATITGVTNYNNLQPITPGTSFINTGQLNASGGVQTNQLTCNGTGIFTSTLQVPALLAVSSVNGSVYPPVIPPQTAAPTASIIMYVGTTAPAGWVFCIGTAYSQTDPLYAPLFAVIGLQFSGGIPGPTFRVPDLRGITTFGASLQSYGNASTPFQITAIDFAALAVSYPGVGIPNNTNPNGLQALGMSAIAVGFDIVKGMVITNTVTSEVRTIIDIVNYKGGNYVNGFIGTYPNYPVLILSSALSITTGSLGQVFNVNPGGAGFYLGNQFPPVAGQTNMITQTPFQVATHTHPQAAGAGGGVPTSGSANPIQGSSTGNIDQNYFYNVPGGTSTLPAVMQVVPANLAVNYLIKL